MILNRGPVSFAVDAQFPDRDEDEWYLVVRTKFDAISLDEGVRFEATRDRFWCRVT